MKKKGRPGIKKIILWAAVLAWIALSSFLSVQTGTESSRLSGSIAAFIADLAKGWLGMNVDMETFHQTLRKAAHILVFLVMGGLLEIACAETGGVSAKWSRPMALCALAACTTIALFNEFQKRWVQGRHCNWDEAALNVLGAAAGVLLAAGIRYCILKRVARKKGEGGR